jgi:hypothetical protein
MILNHGSVSPRLAAWQTYFLDAYHTRAATEAMVHGISNTAKARGRCKASMTVYDRSPMAPTVEAGHARSGAHNRRASTDRWFRMAFVAWQRISTGGHGCRLGNLGSRHQLATSHVSTPFSLPLQPASMPLMRSSGCGALSTFSLVSLSPRPVSEEGLRLRSQPPSDSLDTLLPPLSAEGPSQAIPTLCSMCAASADPSPRRGTR